MNRGASILERLRGLRNGAARHIVAAFALAYVLAVVAPCGTAAAQSAGDSLHAALAAHEHVDPHAHHAAGAHDHHRTATHGDHLPASDDHGDRHCPHCSGDALVGSADHSSCLALEDLTNVAASHAKDAAQWLAPSLAPAAFTLPPPLASPPPPLRAAAIPPVPLNIRHCVFLI